MPLIALIPVSRYVEPPCDDALRALEGRGVAVRKYRGYSAIDSARCQMATDALADGFTELLWVDSDVAFTPADVGKGAGRRGNRCGIVLTRWPVGRYIPSHHIKLVLPRECPPMKRVYRWLLTRPTSTDAPPVA